MRKITLLLFTIILFSSTPLLSQTFASGVVQLNDSGDSFTAEIDITTTEVTLTLVAPANRWFALGFRDMNSDSNGMGSGGDVVIFNGDFTDRTFGGTGAEPSSAETQDWTVCPTCDTVDGTTRTIIATRALDTMEPNDFVFDPSADSIDLVWARPGSATTLGAPLTYHQFSNRGFVVGVGNTLSTPNFNNGLSFSMSPNPARDSFNIVLPSAIQNATLEVYSMLGQRIISTTISDMENSIKVSDWNSGIYIVRVTSGEFSQSKRLIKQ